MFSERPKAYGNIAVGGAAAYYAPPINYSGTYDNVINTGKMRLPAKCQPQ